MLRIALCNDTFLPIVDGVGRVTYQYASALGRLGHECYVITPMQEAGFRGQYPFEIVDYQSVQMPVVTQYNAGMPLFDRHYASRVENIAFDLVHVHSPGFAGLEGVRLAAKRRVPLIGTFHTKYREDIRRVTQSDGLAALGGRYIADFYSRCDEVWVVSENAEAALRSYGYRGKTTLMRNGTDIPDISLEDVQAAKKAFSIQDVPLLLYVGQLDFKKNLDLTLRAMALLQADGIEFQFALAGQGRDKAAMLKLIGELGLSSRVSLLGHIKEQRLLNGLYSLASLLVFPSKYDTAGLVVLEAASAGTPAVVLEHSAAAEPIINLENGFTCAEDAKSLYVCIKEALSDKVRLSSIAKRAKATIPLPWKDVMSEVIERYEQIVEKDKYELKRKRGIFRKELAAGSLEKRKLEMMWRFLSHDMRNVYSYPYTPQVKAKKAAFTAIEGWRSTPSEEGLSNEAVLKLFHAVDRDAALNVHAMLLIRNGKLLAEGYWQPYEAELPHQLYSLSKSIAATAIGMLVDEGRLTLSERIVDIFSDKVEDASTHPLKDVTVWHLLTMSSGVRFDEVGTALGTDWVFEFMNSGLRFEPGTQFFYNSMNTYMLSAIVKRKTGAGLLAYLKPRLFEPLGINSFSWEVCPKGIEKGGWGLSLTLRDVAKIGQLYLQNGRYKVGGEERQLLSSEWVREATRPQIATPTGECRDGYGYQIWMGPGGNSYLFNGAFGQYMLCLPKYNALVCVFSGSANLFAGGNLYAYVSSCFSKQSTDISVTETKTLYAALNGLSLRHREMPVPSMLPMPFKWLCERLNRATFSFSQNSLGLFPMVLQTVHNNYSEGVSSVSFSQKSEDCLELSIKEGAELNTLEFYNQGFAKSELKLKDEAHEVAVSARYGVSQEGETLLRLYIYFLETPSCRILTFNFKGDKLTLCFDEQPALTQALTLLLELTGLSRSELLRNLMPRIKQNKLHDKLRGLAAVSCVGERRH